MSGQKKNLIIALAMVVILGVAYLAMTFLKSDNEDVSEEGILISQSKLKAIQLTISTQGKEVVYVKEGIRWIVRGNENIELVQIAIDQLIAYVKNLEYVSIVAEDMSQSELYGFDKGNEITVLGDNGEELQVSIGDRTVDSQGYYVNVAGDDKIYMVNFDTGQALKKSPDDLRDRFPEFVNYDNSKYIRVEKRDGSSFVIEPSSKGPLAEGYGEFVLLNHYEHPVFILTEELRNNFGMPLYNIYATSFIDEPEDLSVYGLDNPIVTIYAMDNEENTCVIYVGDKNENGNYYARFSNKDFVCTIKGDNFEIIENLNFFDIIGKFFITDDATLMKEITVIGKDIDATFAIDKENGVIGYNGKEISMTEFSEVFKYLSVLTADGEVIKDFGEEEVVISIIKIDGNEDTLRFSTYDNNYYAVEHNGATEFVAGKKSVELILNAIGNIE